MSCRRRLPERQWGAIQNFWPEPERRKRRGDRRWTIGPVWKAFSGCCAAERGGAICRWFTAPFISGDPSAMGHAKLAELDSKTGEMTEIAMPDGKIGVLETGELTTSAQR